MSFCQHRDPEVSIQEALLDQVGSLLLDRAAATAGSGHAAASEFVGWLLV